MIRNNFFELKIHFKQPVYRDFRYSRSRERVLAKILKKSSFRIIYLEVIFAPIPIWKKFIVENVKLQFVDGYEFFKNTNITMNTTYRG